MGLLLLLLPGIGSKFKERGHERREMRASEEQRRGWPREPKGHARQWRQRNEADEAYRGVIRYKRWVQKHKRKSRTREQEIGAKEKLETYITLYSQHTNTTHKLVRPLCWRGRPNHLNPSP